MTAYGLVVGWWVADVVGRPGAGRLAPAAAAAALVALAVALLTAGPDGALPLGSGLLLGVAGRTGFRRFLRNREVPA